MIGVVRQQLLVCDAIPYTSHNSSACVIVDMPDPSPLPALAERAARHLERHALEGSDPGLCVIGEGDAALSNLLALRGLSLEKVEASIVSESPGSLVRVI